MAPDRIGVSVDDLTAALKGFRLLASTDNHGVLPGDVQDPVDAGETLFATLTRMAAHRDPEPDAGTPRFAGDLETAIARLGEVTVRVNGLIALGTILYPGTVAGRILQALNGQQEPEPEPPAVTHSYEYGDRELRAMETVLGALAGLGRDAEERVMSYVAWRLGYLIYPDGDDD